MRPRTFPPPTLFLFISALLVLMPRTARPVTDAVLGPTGQVLRVPSGSGWQDGPPVPASDCSPGSAALPRDVISRSSNGPGYTVDPCGRVLGALPPRAPAGRASGSGLLPTDALASATIDSMTTVGTGNASSTYPFLAMLGSAYTYFLSDGSSWYSGAGTYSVGRAKFDHVEVVGTKLRFFLYPPVDGRLYEQTDFDGGNHSSQGRLGTSSPLLLEAQVGSNRAVLRGNAAVVSNTTTSYGDRFHYFHAAVGSIVPFEIVYTLQSGTWSARTFETQFNYTASGRVWFTLPPITSPLAELTISGPAVVRGTNTFRYRAIARYEAGTLEDVSAVAAWSAEPAALAVVAGGLLTTLPLADPEAVLHLSADQTDGGVSRQATRSVVYRQAVPEDAGTDWPMFQATSRHTGHRAVDLRVEDFQMKWQTNLAVGVALNPVTSTGGRVFCSPVTFFASVSPVWALDAQTGQLLWSRDFGSVFSVNPPSCTAEKVYVQTGNHESNTWLHALDAATGATLFKAPHSAQWERYYAPTIFDGKVYVNGGAYGGMYGFDGTTGQQLWYASLQQYDQWTPAVDEEFAYAYVGNALSVVDRLTGSLTRSTTDPDFVWNGWSTGLAPVLGPSSDIVAINDGRLISFDVAGESIRWQQRSRFQGQPSLAGGAIYALDDGTLKVLNETSGELLWTWAPPQRDLSSNIVVTNTHVFVSSSSVVHAVSRDSRSSVRSFPVGGHLALADGTLFVASASGQLTAIQVATPVPLLAVAGADVTAECTSENGSDTMVRLDGSASTGDRITFSWSAPGITFDDPTSMAPSGRFPLGVTEVSLVVAAGGRTSSDVTRVEVVDTTSPEVIVTSGTPVLWPPDHKWVPVRFNVRSTDGCDEAPALRLLSVTSSEPGTGIERVVNDVPGVAAGSGDFEVPLRAERAGNGLGRSYTVCFEARDASGNTSSGCAEVLVPHDRRGTGGLAANGTAWSATLHGSPLFAVGSLDLGSFRVLRSGAVPLRWDGTAPTRADKNGDRREDVTLSLVAEPTGRRDLAGTAVLGTSFAVWTTSAGTIATPLDELAVAGIGDDAHPPVAFAASPLHNPGRGFSVLRFTLPAAGRVRLSVWDVSGRLVGPLVDRDESAGAHEVRIAPGPQHGSQLYFYRVEWNGESRKGKFVLID